jgi:hypothetical protein
MEAIQEVMQEVRYLIKSLEKINDDSISPETKEARKVALMEAQRLYDELAARYITMAQRRLVQVAQTGGAI